MNWSGLGNVILVGKRLLREGQLYLNVSTESELLYVKGGLFRQGLTKRQVEPKCPFAILRCRRRGECRTIANLGTRGATIHYSMEYIVHGVHGAHETYRMSVGSFKLGADVGIRMRLQEVLGVHSMARIQPSVLNYEYGTLLPPACADKFFVDRPNLLLD